MPDFVFSCLLAFVVLGALVAIPFTFALRSVRQYRHGARSLSWIFFSFFALKLLDNLADSPARPGAAAFGLVGLGAMFCGIRLALLLSRPKG